MTSETQQPVAPTAEEVRRSVTQPAGRRIFTALAVAAVAAVGIGIYSYANNKEPETVFITQAVSRGDIVSSATATGNLQPRTTVTIGSEISGLIKTVDVEDSETIEKGQLLATFDTTDLEGTLALEKAGMSGSSASVRRAQASYDEAVTELARTRGLVERGVSPRIELDSAEAAVVRAKADLDSARANSQRSRAAVDDVNTMLGKTEIRSPIAGVILERNVEPGQTVASSLQAPELFVVAEDLSRMNLEIWIDEADVGVVKAGQTAKFEVSAYPNRRFDAVVESLDISPTMTDNVVTYKALLTVDNADLLLRPGMTASATITTEQRSDVLRVPNSALRFDPAAAAATNQSQGFSLVPMGRGMGGGRGRRGGGGQQEAQRGAMGRVFIENGTELQAVRVQVGETDGIYTEITSDELTEGSKVVIGVGTPEQAAQRNSASDNSKSGGEGRTGGQRGAQ